MPPSLSVSNSFNPPTTSGASWTLDSEPVWSQTTCALDVLLASPPGVLLIIQ